MSRKPAKRFIPAATARRCSTPTPGSTLPAARACRSASASSRSCARANPPVAGRRSIPTNGSSTSATARTTRATSSVNEIGRHDADPMPAAAPGSKERHNTERVPVMSQVLQKPQPQPHPLPATTQDLEAARKVFHQPTLNDRVDAVFVQLWANDEFRRFIDGVYDSD